MFRSLLLAFLASYLFVGCNAESDFVSWAALPRTKVQLPFKEVCGMGMIQIRVEASPNQPNSVKVWAYCHGCRPDSKEWVQDGPGSVELIGHKEKCIVTFFEIHTDNQSRGEATLAIEHKWKRR